MLGSAAALLGVSAAGAFGLGVVLLLAARHHPALVVRSAMVIQVRPSSCRPVMPLMPFMPQARDLAQRMVTRGLKLSFCSVDGGQKCM